jgi:hypothetical protein
MLKLPQLPASQPNLETTLLNHLVEGVALKPLVAVSGAVNAIIRHVFLGAIELVVAANEAESVQLFH